MKKHLSDKIVAKPVSKFPSVERDIAFVVNADVPCENAFSAIKEAAGEYLESVKLFDVYQGDQIEKDKKSMAFNLIFTARDRTLNVEEIDGAVAKILANLKEQIGAELR